MSGNFFRPLLSHNGAASTYYCHPISDRRKGFPCNATLKVEVQVSQTGEATEEESGEIGTQPRS